MALVNMPIEVFFGFIGTALALGLFCLWRQPQIYAGVAFVGIFLLTFSVITGNLIMGYSNTNPYPTSSIDTPIGGVTVYINADSRVIDSNAFGIYNGRILQGETFPTGSSFIGQTINCMSVPMEKVGNPTGAIYFGVFNNSTHPYTDPKVYFGTIDATTLTTGWKMYKICIPANATYKIQNNDVLAVEYENATAGNVVQLLRSFNNDIGTANGYLTFESCWDCNFSVFQVTHQIMTLTLEDVQTVNTLPAPTEIDFQFTSVVKMVFSLLGVMFMLIGAIMGMRDVNGFGYA